MSATHSKRENFGRITEIVQAAARHGFGYFIESHRLGDLILGREHLTLDPPGRRGVHLRELLEELGPTFVKFGQLLSMRPDVLPPDVIAELRLLQADVRPIPFEQVEQVIEEELGLAPGRLFLELDPEPIAAASIGQVHRALLPNGEAVVVKVQRPGAARQIEADLALLYQLARLLRERVRALDFVDTRALVDEFARGIRAELDYRLEGRNCDAMRRSFAGEERVSVPKVYWSYSAGRVLTLEHLDGVTLAEVGGLDLGSEQRAELARLVAETWMAMIFRHGIFHGDPHPANILVQKEGAAIGLVDFGLVGRLDESDLDRLTGFLLDISAGRIEELPRRLHALGVRFPRDQEEALASDLRALYERYESATLSEIDPQQAVRETFAVIFRNHLELPTRFVILDKAIATLAAVGVEVYPEFNVFEVARPYARGLLLERFSPDRLARSARSELAGFARIARDMPYQLHDVLEEMRDGQMEVGFVHKGLDEFMLRITIAFNRLVVALVVAGGLIGSSLIGIFAKQGPHLLGVNVISLICFFISAVLGVWLLTGVVRSGRL
ncbi:MAG: ubiquinone biosynthesis protein [Gaiellaceae bacterium]|nr:ubiquinone biosynthesis protein [Gaiellaceae bacterium]